MWISFPGAGHFHGCESDAFNVNVPVKKVGEDKKGPTHHNLRDCKNTPAEHWLRYHPVGLNTAGLVPDKHEGTAGDVATLGLLRKFDYAVMMNGYKFLLKVTPAGISKEMSWQFKIISLNRKKE